MKTKNKFVSNADDSGLNSVKPQSDKKHSRILLNSFSGESSNHFNKIHKRSTHAFGCGHEPGAIKGV